MQLCNMTPDGKLRQAERSVLLFIIFPIGLSVFIVRSVIRCFFRYDSAVRAWIKKAATA
jgi:hypothetical protein